MGPGCWFIAAAFASTLPGQTFTGSVVEDHTGHPVRGARIQVRAAGAPRMTADLESEADGKFLAAVNLPVGEYRVDVSKPNFAGANMVIRVPLRAPLAIRLIRLGSISGRVTDSQQLPLRGAAVMLMVEEGGGRFRQFSMGYAQQSGEDGRYRLFHIAPGRYAVAVTWATMNATALAGTYLFPNNQRPEVFDIASGTAIQGIDFSMPPQSEYSVSGKVLSAEPSAVALVLRDQPSLAAAMMRTDTEGGFKFDKVAPGSYELVATAPATGYAAFGAMLGPEPLFARAPVEVAAQHVTGISVSPEAGRTVRFSLQSPPGCARSATVTLEPVENWGALLFRTIELAEGGEQAVKHLAPGTYRATVSKPAEGCFGEQNRVFDTRKTETLRIALAPGGSVEGKTETAAMVVLEGAAQERRMAMPDANGRFRFAGLRPGIYRLRAGAAVGNAKVESNTAAQVELKIPEKTP